MQRRAAFTLMELIVVLSILAALTGVLAPVFSSTISDAKEESSKRTLIAAREALMLYWLDIKHVSLDGGTVGTDANRLSIDWLFANPVDDALTFDFSPLTQIGWRGPYLAESTGDQVAAGERYLIDGWNNTVVIQDVDYTATPRDVRIVSGGPDGTIDIPTATATSALTDSDVGDDIYVAITLQ